MESLKHLSEAISPHEREKKMNQKKKRKKRKKKMEKLLKSQRKNGVRERRGKTDPIFIPLAISHMMNQSLTNMDDGKIQD